MKELHTQKDVGGVLFKKKNAGKIGSQSIRDWFETAWHFLRHVNIWEAIIVSYGSLLPSDVPLPELFFSWRQ